MSDRRFSAESRSIRLTFGRERLLIERNSTHTFDAQPYCVKSRSRDFLSKLMGDAGLDVERIFRGSYNHMAFLNRQEANSLMGAMPGLVPLDVPQPAPSGPPQLSVVGDGDLSDGVEEDEDDEDYSDEDDGDD